MEILGEILSKNQCNSTQLKLVDDLCFCSFRVHLFLPPHSLLNIAFLYNAGKDTD